jgi:hypothetical protein
MRPDERLPTKRTEDLVRLGHPSTATLALGRLAGVRADKADSVPLQRVDVRLRRGMRPHARVHRRRDEDRPAMRQRGLRDEVVREPVGELGECVRRRRRDDEELGTRQMRIRILTRRAPCEREERVCANKAFGVRRDERDDVVAALDEQPHELAGLVRGDPACDADQHASHDAILPALCIPDAPRG